MGLASANGTLPKKTVEALLSVNFSLFPIFPYLIFVIFFTRTKCLENKIYTEKRQFFALNL